MPRLSTVLLLCAIAASRTNAQPAHAALLKLLTAPAKPLRVTPTVATKPLANGLIIAKNGGTISGTSASGVRFDLIVPPNAIKHDTTFSLYEIKSLKSGTTVANNVLAVKITPEGLRFDRRVDLVITKPALIVDWATLTPFMYQGTGSEAQLAFRDPNFSGIRIPLVHLSGIGVLDSPSMRELMASSVPTALADRLHAELTRISTDKTLSGPEQMAAFANMYDTIFQEVYKPRFEQMQTCTGSNALLIDYYSTVRFLDALGLTNWNSAHGDAAAQIASKGQLLCNKEYGLACVQQHHISEFVDYALRARKNVQLLGGSTTSAAYVDLRAWEMRCLQFRMELSLAYTFKKPAPPGSPTTSADETVSFEWKLDGNSTGKGMVNITDANVESIATYICRVAKTENQPDTAAVVDIDPLSELADRTHPGVSLFLRPGLPLTRLSGACHVSGSSTQVPFEIPPKLPTPTPLPQSVWGGYFALFHRDEVSMLNGAFRIQGWQASNAELFWQKRYHRYEPVARMWEDGTIVVRHVPK